MAYVEMVPTKKKRAKRYIERIL